MKSSSSPSSDVIVLDSDDDDDDDDETKPETVEYHNVEDPHGEIRKIPDYFMAYGYPPDPAVRLPYGLRIIARRKQEHFPVGYSKLGRAYLYHNDDTAFYAGILSCECRHHDGQFSYMVFFDDGHVQYVTNNNIRVVFGNYGKRYVHENAQKFYDYYFYRVKIKRMMEIACVLDRNIMVYVNNRLELAQVCGYDHDERRALVLLHFLKSNLMEW